MARGAHPAARYGAPRARLIRLADLGRRPSCGPGCWLPELTAFNEDLRRLFVPATSRVTTASGERIRDVVAAHYGVTHVELIGASAVRLVARARQVAMYICARHAGLPSRDIATLFGDRDQSTVRFAVRAVAARQRRIPAHAAEITALIVKCRQRGSA